MTSPSRNTFVLPYRLFKTYSKVPGVEPSPYVGDDRLLFIDDDGHVHEMKHLGRSVPPNALQISVVVDTEMPEGEIHLVQDGKVVGRIINVKEGTESL